MTRNGEGNSLDNTVVVLSCDEKYFPLAKGTLLSILERKPPGGIPGLAFLDIGCEPASLEWLRDRGVLVRTPSEAVMGEFAHASFGYHRSQICRPFLPDLFPGFETYIWLDCDVWVQGESAIEVLRDAAVANPGKMALCPECHYSYTFVNDRVTGRRAELYSYCEPTYGAEIAERMADRTMLNSGVFALSGSSPVWSQWKQEVSKLYSRSYEAGGNIVRHFAEQVALNFVLANRRNAVLVDPLFNYICLWKPPYVDADGVVRVSMIPNAKVEIVHLAGGWRKFGKAYFERGLLYRGGAYLTEQDKQILFDLLPEGRPLEAVR